jgi:ABC-type spermidine/putrescine transport system permease subunit I
MVRRPSIMSRQVIALLIPLTFILSFFLLPLGEIARASLRSGVPQGFVPDVFSNALYRRTINNTIYIGAVVSFATALLGVPAAYLLALTRSSVSRFLVLLVAASMWLSILVRSYAWTLLLQGGGFVASALFRLGIIHSPRSFLFTRGAVVTGMVHILLPYMIFLVWSSIQAEVREFRDLAYSLGASPMFYIFRVLLPQSFRGISGGIVLVFVLSIGFYITPELLGGGNGNTMMIGVLIDQQINSFGNWRAGAVLSSFMLASVAFIVLAGLLIPLFQGFWLVRER